MKRAPLRILAQRRIHHMVNREADKLIRAFERTGMQLVQEGDHYQVAVDGEHFTRIDAPEVYCPIQVMRERFAA